MCHCHLGFLVNIDTKDKCSHLIREATMFSLTFVGNLGKGMLVDKIFPLFVEIRNCFSTLVGL